MEITLSGEKQLKKRCLKESQLPTTNIPFGDLTESRVSERAKNRYETHRVNKKLKTI